MSALQAQALSDLQALVAIEPEWQRLWRAQPRREIFTTPAWCLAACGGSPHSARVIVVRRGARVVGLLPLADTGAAGSFLSGANADYNDLLVDDADACAVVAAALREALQAWPRLELDNIPEWSTLARVLPQLPEDLRRHIDVQPGAPCPALRLQASRDTLLAAMAGKKSLKRHDKKLAQHGAVVLRHLDDRGEIRSRLPDFFQQHVARRALAGGRSLFLDARARQFYERLLEAFDPSAELRFAVLESGGRTVAYHLGFEIDGRFTWYKPSFDVDYWDCGVGEVLLKRLFEYIAPRSVHEFDFTRGDEAFKDRFSNHQGHNQRWVVQRRAAATRLTRARRELRAILKASAWVRALRDAAAQPVWARDEVAVFGAEPQTLLRALQSSIGPGVEVLPAGWRTLALLATQEGAPLDLHTLGAVRADQQPGDVFYVARVGEAAVGIARLGQRTSQSDGATQPPLPTIELVGAGWRRDERVVASLLATLAAAAAPAPLRLHCPTQDRRVMQWLQQWGCAPLWRSGRTRLFGRTQREWCTPCAASA